MHFFFIIRLQPSIWNSNPPSYYSILDDKCDSYANEQTSTSSSSYYIGGTLEQKLAAMRAAVVKFLGEQQQLPKNFSRERDSSVSSVISVSRIFIPEFANLAANYGFSDGNIRQIIQFMLGIKQLVRDNHSTVAFTIHSLSCPDILISKLKWATDTVLSVDSFAGRLQSVPFEFKEFCGLLSIERVQQVGAIASFKPPGSKFGLKRDSRKLHVEPLHLPPEESRTGTAGTTAAAVAATKDGYAAAPTMSSIPVSGYATGRIEVQVDNSTVTAPSSSDGIERTSSSPAPISIAHHHLQPTRVVSKYEEKGSYDEPGASNSNQAAKSIFSRARADGLLPGPIGLKDINKPNQRTAPLLPGSACAPGRPGDKNSSLDF